MKAFNTWQGSQNTLAKKKETETKLQVGGKPEKLAQVQQEIKDVRKWRDWLQACQLLQCLPSPFLQHTHMQWEVKVEEGQKNFDDVSKTLKREVERFEVSPYPSLPPFTVLGIT